MYRLRQFGDACPLLFPGWEYARTATSLAPWNPEQRVEEAGDEVGSLEVEHQEGELDLIEG